MAAGKWRNGNGRFEEEEASDTPADFPFAARIEYVAHNNNNTSRCFFSIELRKVMDSGFLLP